MKSLDEMHNVELAKLLATLCPGAIPDLLKFMEVNAADLVAHPEKLRKVWQDNPLVSFEGWIAMAGKVVEVIKLSGTKMPKRPALFADQLFDGFLAMYTREVTHQYAKQQDCPRRFRQAVELIFKG